MARMWAWRASKTIPISTCEVLSCFKCVSSKEYQFKLPWYRSAIKALFITSCISLRQDLFFTSSTRAAERKLKYGFYGEKKLQKFSDFYDNYAWARVMESERVLWCDLNEVKKKDNQMWNDINAKNYFTRWCQWLALPVILWYFLRS